MYRVMTQYTYQERFRTVKGVFDEFTNRNLFDLEKKGEFDELLSPLDVGKESNVFIAKKGDEKVIVKIYRIQNSNFNKMFDYIRKDPRYEFLKQKRRDIIFAWTQREFKNLTRAHSGGVKVPKPLAFKHNIIVEEFIGNDKPAPPLKNLAPNYPHQFLQDIITEMKKLYDCGLIHGDLSSFNILNENDKPVLIDFSQATMLRTPNSEELLERDIKNIITYFKKLQVDVDFNEMFFKITGKQKEE